jgi:NADP-dependent 3-hydroxy acid dehydrogenase YdfG
MLGQNPDEMEWKEGDHLPQEMLDQVAAVAKNMVMSPGDIAEAVMYALSVPENVQVSEIMIRPLMQLQIPGFSLPA